MTEPVRIGVWFKRMIIFAGVLLLLAAVALYLMATSLTEALLRPSLEARGGDLQLASVEFGWSGVEVNIESYKEPALSVSGATLSFGWSDLLELPSRISGKVDVAFVVIDLPVKDAEAEALDQDVSAQMEMLADQLHSLPLNILEVNIEQLTLKSASQSIEMHFVANVLTGVTGERHLSVEVEGELFTAKSRAKLSDAGHHLGVDFVASVSKWEQFRASFLSEVFEKLSAKQVDVFIEPVAEDIGFLELSGYLRWDQQEPKQCGLTVLADVGAIEIYTPTGESYLGKTSCGFTMDGAGRMRTFGKGTIESTRLGSWSESDGNWELKLNDAHAAVEIRLSDEIEISLSHDNWRQLQSGNGSGRYFIETKEADFSLLHALNVSNLPPDLTGSFSTTAQGEYSLKDSKVAAAKLQIDLDLKEVNLPEKGVIVEKAKAQGRVELADDELSVDEFTLLVGAMGVRGVAISEFAVEAAGQSSGRLELEAMSAQLLGGELRVGGLKFDSSDAAAVPIRIELDSVDMQQLSESVPQFKGEVEGRLTGYLLCEWADGSLSLKDGLLQIDEETEARLSYNVDGLLTNGMNPESVAYQQYRMAEVAFQDMLLKRFRVDVFPEGESTRPLRIELFGESTQEGVVVPVDYTLNVNADDAEGLMHLLQMIRSGQLELN